MSQCFSKSARLEVQVPDYVGGFSVQTELALLVFRVSQPFKIFYYSTTKWKSITLAQIQLTLCTLNSLSSDLLRLSDRDIFSTS